MVVSFRDQRKDRAVSMLRGALKDTPIPHWRGDPICAALLECYDRFDPVVDGFSDVVVGSVMRGALYWSGQPEQFPDGEYVEEWCMDEVSFWLTEQLLEPLKNWMYEVNASTGRVLDAFFAQALGRENVGFPLLYMGELQLYLAREIGYDLIVMANGRIRSCGLSRILRPPCPERDNRRSRGYRLACFGPKLADELEKERLELRLRLNAYFLNEEFLSRYRDCVLETVERWADGWGGDPGWGRLRPFLPVDGQEEREPN